MPSGSNASPFPTLISVPLIRVPLIRVPLIRVPLIRVPLPSRSVAPTLSAAVTEA